MDRRLNKNKLNKKYNQDKIGHQAEPLGHILGQEVQPDINPCK